MSVRYILLFFVAFSLSISFTKAKSYCSRDGKKDMHKTTVADPAENNYDIKHLKLDISLANTSTSISGSATTTAVTTVNNFDKYVFELDPQITIDSLRFNGIIATVQSSGAVRTVNLNTPLSVNTTFTTQVFYHGQPQSGTGGFFTGGLNQVTLSSGTPILYTLSDPDRTDEWWPCKQSLTDKIDSADIWITVDDTLKAGSNGLLQGVTSLGGGKSRYEWKTNYPIDYYLITVAVAPYIDYSYYMHFTDGSNDSMLIQNYIYDSARVMTTPNKAALDSTGLFIDHLSKLYGKYPFYKEKYGHCLAESLGGGMEHQTMTTLGSTSTKLIAHEMGHQWWGNNVTYSSWKDIWLSEGFATYTEQLFIEEFWGVAAAKNERTSVFNNVMQATYGSVYVDDTTSVNRIFDGRLTYSKGASVVHMLRYLAPVDSLFFVGLRQFQQQYAFGNAVTEDLKNTFEPIYGFALDSFFNQWVYGQGYPTYSVKYYQSGSTIYLQINQTTSYSAVTPLFHMPIELKLKSANGDKTITLYNNSPSQNFIVQWNEQLTGIDVDPDNHIVNKTGLIQEDQSILSVGRATYDNITVYPNPASDQWKIDGLPNGSSCRLLDVSGKMIWGGTASGQTLIIPAIQVANGVYMLEVTIDSDSVYYKLVK